MQAAALVFNLKSNIIGRESREKREIKGIKLYELGTIEIPVNNPFDSDVDFTIRIENIELAPSHDSKKKRKAKKRMVRGRKEDVDDKPKEDPKVFIPSFFSRRDKIKIRHKGDSKLQIFYLPMTFENHKCHIIFVDERNGEMQYELIGTPELPQPLETIKMYSWLDSNKEEEIGISQKNTNFSIAAGKLKERLRELKRDQMREEVMNLIGLAQEDTTFNLDINPPGFITVPPLFTIQKSIKPELDGKLGDFGNAQYGENSY